MLSGKLARKSMTLGLGRSGPVIRNLICREQEGQALQDIAHFVGSENADAVDKSSSIDGSDLGDIDDTRPRKSCLTSPEAHVSWHASEPQVRRDGRNDRGGDGASIEAVVLDDKCGPAPRGC